MQRHCHRDHHRTSSYHRQRGHQQDQGDARGRVSHLCAHLTAAAPPPEKGFEVEAAVRAQVRSLILPYLMAWDEWQNDPMKMKSKRDLVAEAAGGREDAFVSCQEEVLRAAGPKKTKDPLFQAWNEVLENLDWIHKTAVLESMKEEERRWAPDRNSYTKAEFQEYYGAEWKEAWEGAQVVQVDSPEFVMREDVKTMLYEMRNVPALREMRDYLRAQKDEVRPPKGVVNQDAPPEPLISRPAKR